MALIYGRISGEKPDNSSDFQDNLSKILSWKGSIHKVIEYGYFLGGFIFDGRLPYRDKDIIFIDHKREILILLSGILYNRNELKKQLQLTVENPVDPELIFFAFSAWGDNFVRELNGDFAIFIYQKKEGISYLYRDHMGNRPVSFSLNREALWFSSDSIGLSKALYGKEAIHPDYFGKLMVKFGLDSAPLLSKYHILPNIKVQKVLPAHYAVFKSSTCQIKKYWFPESIFPDKKMNFEQITNELKLLVADAVRIRCDDRFIASTHLSSGLDSSIIAYFARQNYFSQDQFVGFSWTPEGNVKSELLYDERDFVNKVSERCKITPVFITIDGQTWKENISDWENSTDLFNECVVREIAKSKGINLIFSGWGGDEFISINSIGIDSELLFNFQWKSFFKRNPVSKPKKLLIVLLIHILLPSFNLRFYSPKKRLPQFCKYLRYFKGAKVRTINDLYHWRSRRDMHLNYLYNYHIPERIEDWFIDGYRNGIEYRFPLIDKRIIEYMLKIPSAALLKDDSNRIVMREIGRGILPDEVINNRSKNDPVREILNRTLLDSIALQLMQEINEFKLNPEFNFINFDKLTADIEKYNQEPAAKHPSELFEILFFLLKADQFIKEYHNIHSKE
jgi:asparagine synthase (glutamine-hydrolysing)